MHGNSCRIHQSLRVIPAMKQASDHLWSLEEIIASLDSRSEEICGVHADGFRDSVFGVSVVFAIA
jgi:hypothetical protein